MTESSKRYSSQLLLTYAKQCTLIADAIAGLDHLWSDLQTGYSEVRLRNFSLRGMINEDVYSLQ